jgi:tetratricopeptide (TPR) repeat protein
LPQRMTFKAAIAALALVGMVSSALAAKKEEAPADVATDACGVRKMTKKVDKPLLEAQKARDAKDWPTAIAKVAEAEAVPVEKSPYDLFWIHEFRGIAYVNSKDYAKALPDLAASYESPCMDAKDKAARGKLLMQLAYQIKDYPKAIEYGKSAQALNDDPEIGVYLANAYYITNDYANTKTVSTDTVKKLEAAGKVPDETLYRILESACVHLKDNPCIAEQIENLVVHYPKPAYWLDLTNSLLRVSTNDKELLNILRLADGANAMNEPSHFTEMAQLAMGQGLPGESQSILEKGVAKGVFAGQKEKDLANRILSEAKQAVALDKSTLAKQDASARAKPTGESDVKLGAAYLSYGEHDKAIEALQRGLGKGGVKDTDEAGLLLGMAYMRANNKAEAAKAFETVTKNPTLSRIARLWILAGREPGTAG